MEFIFYALEIHTEVLTGKICLGISFKTEGGTECFGVHFIPCSQVHEGFTVPSALVYVWALSQ